ncbi:MAG: class II aldolase/adducin family protein [Chloroflexota bacterium]
MQPKEDLKKCGCALFERRLIWGRSGNISVRVAPDSFLISSTGSNLGLLNDDDLVLCRISQDTWEGMKQPSMESGLHRGIYQVTENTVAIIHSQPFYASLIACSQEPLLRPDLLPETMAYLGRIERVPYDHAGSRELALAVAAAARISEVLILDNHGVVCRGSSLAAAMLKTEALEFLCRLLVVSARSGIRLRYMGEDVMKDFGEHLRRTGKQH